MSDPISPASGVRLSGASLTAMFLAFLVGGILLVWLLYWLSERFFGFSPESNVMGFLVPIFAAMAVGQVWYQREGGRPASGRAWAMAVVWTLLTQAVLVGLLVLAWKAGVLEEMLGSRPTHEDLKIFALVMLGIGVFQFLALRASLWAAFRGAAKQAERLAARKG